MRHAATLIIAAACVLPACRDKEVSAAPQNPVPTEKHVPPATPPKPTPAPLPPPSQPTPPAPTPPAANESDTRIAQEIRMAIMDKSSLSTNAHNVQVTCTDGIVTLKGPVDSEVERDTVGSLAEAVLGVTRVDNQLEVKP